MLLPGSPLALTCPSHPALYPSWLNLVPGFPLTSIRVMLMICLFVSPTKLGALWEAVKYSSWELGSGYGADQDLTPCFHHYCVTHASSFTFPCLNSHICNMGLGTVPVFINVGVRSPRFAHRFSYSLEDSAHNLLNAVIYYRERTQSIISKWERCMG